MNETSSQHGEDTRPAGSTGYPDYEATDPEDLCSLGGKDARIAELEGQLAEAVGAKEKAEAKITGWENANYLRNEKLTAEIKTRVKAEADLVAERRKNLTAQAEFLLAARAHIPIAGESPVSQLQREIEAHAATYIEIMKRTHGQTFAAMRSQAESLTARAKSMQEQRDLRLDQLRAKEDECEALRNFRDLVAERVAPDYERPAEQTDELLMSRIADMERLSKEESAELMRTWGAENGELKKKIEELETLIGAKDKLNAIQVLTQQNAELAAALDALMADEYLQKRVQQVRLGRGTATEYGQVIMHVIETGYPAILAAHDAEVRSQALKNYLLRQIEFSTRAFGPGLRTGGNTRHIEKELAEIRANPADLSEWIDVITLACDGYWRHGGKPENLLADMEATLARNITREWPSPKSEDEPVEHIKEPTCTIGAENGELRKQNAELTAALRLAHEHMLAWHVPSNLIEETMGLVNYRKALEAHDAALVKPLVEALTEIRFDCAMNLTCHHPHEDSDECGDIDDCIYHSILQTTDDALAPHSVPPPAEVTEHAVHGADRGPLLDAEFDRGWKAAEEEIADNIATGCYARVPTDKLWEENLRQHDAALVEPLVAIIRRFYAYLEPLSHVHLPDGTILYARAVYDALAAHTKEPTSVPGIELSWKTARGEKTTAIFLRRHRLLADGKGRFSALNSRGELDYYRDTSGRVEISFQLYGVAGPAGPAKGE